MLSRLAVSQRFRSLSERTFEENVRFGPRTIVYGHNGSGKSSLAEMLLQLGEGRHAHDIQWTDEFGVRTNVAAGIRPPGVVLSVFTKSWIKENLYGFLDGQTAHGIVTLGSEAIGAAEKQLQAETELEGLTKRRPKLEREFRENQEATRALASSTQDAIVDLLRPVDNYYSKSRYNDPRVRSLLREVVAAVPGDDEHAQNVLEVAKPALAPVTLYPLPAFNLTDLRSKVESLLRRTVASQLLEELVGNGELQAWVARGLELHDKQHDCHFCGNDVTDDRMASLRQHFDDSRTQVQTEATALRRTIADTRGQLRDWRQGMPALKSLYSRAREAWPGVDAEQERVHIAVAKFLDELDALVSQKFRVPENISLAFVPDVPDVPVSADARPLVELHNTIAENADQHRKNLCESILTHVVGSRGPAYRDLEAAEVSVGKELSDLNDSIAAVDRRLTSLRSLRFSSARVAAKLTDDLMHVYGKNHLSIQVTQDGKTYRCLRDGAPADNLSEGERNTLALLYFLRRLEDESERVAKKTHIVVIDDPSSSLDRESVFATHAWLLEVLVEFGQSIILTHDFEMLRLLLTSQKNQISKHRSISGQRATAADVVAADREEQYPRVAFMEMYSRAGQAAQRTSHLVPISSVLLNYPSEYHYLFDRVMRGVAEPGDHYALFLLPNAARRMLESFASFAVPDRPNFEAQLRKLTLEDSSAEFRDVYDFCNRYSHGEGREAHELLDARTVSHQLRRCMELLSHADQRHFDAMCAATRHNVNLIRDIPAVG